MTFCADVPLKPSFVHSCIMRILSSTILNLIYASDVVTADVYLMNVPLRYRITETGKYVGFMSELVHSMK